MKTIKSAIVLTLIYVMFPSVEAQEDTLAIHNLGHASLMFEYNDLIIHVDPRSQEANYNNLPDADLIFVTHSHGDHYDPTALNKITKTSTILVTTQEVKNLGTYSGTVEVMANGDTSEFSGITVVAVPAYNHTAAFHTKGVGNGYVLSFGQTKVYVAGDTEDVPEMDTLDVNIAFIPMNQPYTMTPEQAANAALMINPDILYVYHFGNSDTAKLRNLLKDHDSIEVRIGESLYYLPERPEIQEPPVGLETNVHQEINISPNPVDDHVFINQLKGTSQIYIYNIEGKILKSVKTTDTSIKIELNDLPAGNYFLEIKGNDNIEVKKFNLVKRL